MLATLNLDAAIVPLAAPVFQYWAAVDASFRPRERRLPALRPIPKSASTVTKN